MSYVDNVWIVNSNITDTIKERAGFFVARYAIINIYNSLTKLLSKNSATFLGNLGAATDAYNIRSKEKTEPTMTVELELTSLNNLFKGDSEVTLDIYIRSYKKI